MTDFLADLQSVRWWLGVVIVGILVNVLGNYFHIFLGARLAATSTWWGNRQKAKDLEYKADLESLRSKPQEVNALESSEKRSLLRSIESLIKSFAWGVLTIFFVTINAPSWITIPLLLMFAVSWILYIFQHRAAIRTENLLKGFYATDPRDKKEIS